MANALMDVRYLPLHISQLVRGISFLILGYAALQTVLIPFQIEGRLKSDRSGAVSAYEPIVPAPVEAILEPFATHALFYIPKAAPAPVKGPGLAELLAQFELTGIIQGAEPEALVQSRANKQTYFIQLGEQFEQFRLVEIKEHSVIVESNGERGELMIQGGS